MIMLFENKIQAAWDDFKTDFGIGRILLLLLCYNLFLFFLTLVFLGQIHLRFLAPIIFAIPFYLFRYRLKSLKSGQIVLIQTIPLVLSIIYNYYMVGAFNTMSGGLDLYDGYIAQIEQFLFGQLVGLILEQFISQFNFLGVITYDLMITGYILYYLLPYFGLWLYYKSLSHQDKYKIGRYLGSLVIFFCLNYLCYILIPVTGPQYYFLSFYQNTLPLSSYGQWIYNTIQSGQANHIDCFPSGHFGATLLVTIWFVRIQHPIKNFLIFLTTIVAFATLSLRYHYALDLVFALPLSLLSYYCGKKLIPVSHR